MTIVDKLDQQQRLAAESKHPITIVVAGPGSGKTATLVERVLILIERGIPQEGIVIFTLTNAAANEIEQRLAATVGHFRGYVGTMHAWCLRLVSREGWRIGYRKNRRVSIVGEEDWWHIVKEAKSFLKYDKVTNAAITEGVSPAARAIRAETADRLKRNNSISYDGLITEAARLAAHTETSALLVDEAQDCDEADWLLIRSIPAETKTYFGDTDQSIFAFRGSRPEYYANEAGVRFLLERNYRSDVHICQVANLLISHNGNRIEKVTNPHSNDRGHVGIIEIDNGRHEATTIATMLRTGREAFSFPEMAVIARTHEIAGAIRDGVREMGIPVAEPPRVNIPKEISTLRACLAMIRDPLNNIVAERYLRGVGTPLTALNRAIAATMTTGRPLSETVSGLDRYLASNEENLLTGILPELSRLKIDEECLALVRERKETLPEQTLDALIADLWNPDKWDVAEDRISGVTISTIHAAKGREFDLVIVAGCEEGVLPSSNKPEEIEEQRRLMFVAVTRARHFLYLTHCASRVSYGQRRNNPPSRYLDEMIIPKTANT